MRKKTTPEWLREFLSAGPKPVDEVLTAGEAAGFSDHALRVAQRRSEIQSYSVKGQNFWGEPPIGVAVEAARRGRRTISDSGVSKKEQAQNRRRQEDFRERQAEAKASQREVAAKYDPTDTSSVTKDEAKRILREHHGVSAEHVDAIHRLGTDALHEMRLEGSRFFWTHGPENTQKSITTGEPVLLEQVENPDGDVEGQLLTRADLYAIWNFGISYLSEKPGGIETFEAFLRLLFEIKNDFFKLNEICGKDFDRESYESWVDLMPKLDPVKLRRGYTQREMREFLNVSEVKQRLLVASRNSMKSSFILLWLTQQILICPDLRVILLSETKPLSFTFLGQLRNYFEIGIGGPTPLQRLFASYCVFPEEGRQSELRSPMARLNLTVGVISSSYESGGFAGNRADLIISDDPLSEETVQTPDAIKKTIKKYDAVSKLLEVGSLGSVVIMTPWAVNDLGAELQERNAQALADGDETFLAYRVDPAFEIKPEARAKAEKNLLDLEESDVELRFKRLNWEFLRKEMRAGRADNFRFFKSQSLCRWDHLSDETTKCTFVETELRARTKPQDFFEPMAVRETILAIDCAWSKSQWADFSALPVVKIIFREGRTMAVVVDCKMGRWNMSELATQIVQANHDHNPTRVVCQKEGPWQSLNLEIMKQAMYRNFVPPQIYWKAANLGSSFKSKALRIKVLETYIADESLYFCSGLWNEQLFSQLVGFDGISTSNRRKNDGPDALALALENSPMSSEESQEQTEEEQRRAEAEALRVAEYNRIFGNRVASVPREEDESPAEPTSPWNIPGLRGVGNLPVPAGQRISFRDLNKRN